MQTTSRSNTIAFLETGRVFGILAVILLHASSELLFRFQPVITWQWWLGNSIAATTHWAVPLFMMISGALHLGKVDNLQSFYFKKVKRIVLPLLIWIVLYAMFYHWYRGDSLSIQRIMERIVRDQPYEHLYFLFILFELFLLTPLLNRLLKTSTHLQVFAVTLSVMLTVFWNPGRWILTIWIPFLSYYLLGYYCLHFKTKLNVKLLSILAFGCILLMLVMTALLTTHTLPNQDGFYFFGYASPLTIILTSSIFLLLKQKVLRSTQISPQIRTLASASYGVFFIHMMFIEIGRLLTKTISLSMENAILYVGFLFVYSSVCSIVVVTTFQKAYKLIK